MNDQLDPNMEHLEYPGDVCFTTSEAKKLTERIKKDGFAVRDLQGVWIHYTHLRPSDPATGKVSQCRDMILLSAAVKIGV